MSPVDFICVDGEGITDENGIHKYVLLGVGQDQIENPEGLSWREIFNFLYSRFREGGVSYCGYFLGYDFTQWLSSLPEYKAHRLLRGADERRRKTKGDYSLFWPVDLDGWEFDILGMKRLKLRPIGAKRWMYICDAGSFFQMSFLKAINPENHAKAICTTEEYANIERGKSARTTASLDNDMRRYNQKENEICARLLGSLDEGFREMGIHLSPRQWFGPGQAAQEWLSQRIPPTKATDKMKSRGEKGLLEDVPDWFLKTARQSYFGGWFEIMAHGIIPGTTYEYDINSAYPSIIAHLPCLQHGEFSRGFGKPPDNISYVLTYARVWSAKPGNRNHKPVGAMLHRRASGNIYRPQVTEGWFWKHELDSARRAGFVVSPREDQYGEWMGYSPCSCPPPLSEVAHLYNLRQQAGKKTPLGIAAKLCYNSMYGKFAQSVGEPKFGNAIYASLITSLCRTMITDAIATHPEGMNACVMVATDGVYFTSPHPELDISDKLGEWDYGTKENICLFKPGMYWDDAARRRIAEGDAPVFKSRGISARDFASQIGRIDQQFYAFLESESIPTGCAALGFEGPEWPTVEFPIQFSMVTANLALHRGQWETAGLVSTDTFGKQSAMPFNKRERPYFDKYIRSMPHAASFNMKERKWNDFKSVPYDKKFGIEDDPWHVTNQERFGLMEEGYPVTELYDALGMRE